MAEETLEVYESLQKGDRVELKHEVKVGFRRWTTTTVGEVIDCERRRHSLHHQRSADDKVYSDVIVLRRDDGSTWTDKALTTYGDLLNGFFAATDAHDVVFE